MKLQKIPVEEATEQQLRDFARDVLGIEIHHSAKHATCIAKVKEAWDKPEIMVAVTEPAAEAGSDVPESKEEPAQPPRPVTAAQRPPKAGYVRVRIDIQDIPGGNEPVPVGVNGKVMVVPRAKECDIPEAYYEVLENSVSHIYDPLPDGKGINPEPRKVPSIPVALIARGPKLAKAA